MYKKIILVGGMLLILIATGIFESSFYAHERGALDTYYVKPLLPENQSDKIEDFFDLRMAPSQAQMLSMIIVNETDEEKIFHAEVLDSFTSHSGSLIYKKEGQYDTSLIYKMTDLLSVAEDLVIPAHQTKELKLHLQMPEKPFDGLLLGAIKVSEIIPRNGTEGISNVFSYITPIKIQETTEVIQDQLIFKGVKVKNIENQKKLVAEINHPKATILKELKLKSQVTKIFGIGKKEPIIQEQKNLRVAPNSHFSYSLFLGEEPITAGKYKIELEASSLELSERWSDTITLTKDDAKKLNSLLVVPEKANKWQVYVLSCLLLLMICLSTYSIILYRRNHSSKNDDS